MKKPGSRVFTIYSKHRDDSGFKTQVMGITLQTSCTSERPLIDGFETYIEHIGSRRHLVRVLVVWQVVPVERVVLDLLPDVLGRQLAEARNVNHRHFLVAEDL